MRRAPDWSGWHFSSRLCRATTEPAALAGPPASLMGELSRLRDLGVGSNNVDMSLEEFVLHANTELVEHVMGNIRAYEAMLTVIAMAAGIKEDTLGVRDAIARAATEYGQSLYDRSQREHWTEYIGIGDLVGYVAGGATIAFGGAADLFGFDETAAGAYSAGTTIATTDPGRLVENVVGDFLTSIWNEMVAYYNWFMNEVDENGLLIAVGKAAIDAWFLAAEIALDIALGALTGGAGAAAGVVIRVTAQRVARTTTRIVIRAARKGDIRMPDQPELLRTTLDDADIPADIDRLADEDLLGGGTRLDDTDSRRDAPAARPTTTYTRGNNTATIVTDPETGRPVSGSATITEDFGSGDRLDNATEIGREYGQAGDHGGHIFAHRYFGDVPDAGIIPQAGNLNTGAWKTMENEWADWINVYGPNRPARMEIEVNVDIDPPGAARPDRITVEYVVTEHLPDGTSNVVRDTRKTFRNEAGEEFERVYFRSDGTIR